MMRFIKLTYDEAQLEIVEFDPSDIIVTSGDSDEDDSQGGSGGSSGDSSGDSSGGSADEGWSGYH